MSDEFWNITLRLGSWSGQVKMPKSIFGTAESAINQALLDIQIANDNRNDGADAHYATNPEHNWSMRHEATPEQEVNA